ncbi:hypothetical protein [Halosegnis marinus]|uniref:hypothetical protein n=1 Tax=Halosegnis marinus TaxID=3034023 RepID=UPI0036233D65
MSANRTVSVNVADDSNALLSLVPGESGLVTQQDGTLQVNIDGTQSAGTGANMDAVTTIGDPENPADDHAFKIVNQGTQSLMFKMNYFFENTGWLENRGKGQSHLNFEVFDVSTGSTDAAGSYAEDYPHQSYNRDSSLGQPAGSGFGSNSDYYRFDVGEELYMVLTVDTTGENASLDDDLSGTAVIEAGTETSQDSWYPSDPPA